MMKLGDLPLNARAVIRAHSVDWSYLHWLGYWVEFSDGQQWKVWRQFPAGALGPMPS